MRFSRLLLPVLLILACGKDRSTKPPPADVTPPAPIADLAASAAGATSLTLTWTAPGNDGGEGRAVEYDLRRSFVPITAEGWNAAERVTGVPAPNSAGTPESFLVAGLQRQKTYHFALQTRDGGPNWSGLSNQVSGATVPPRRLTTSPASGIGAVMPAWSPDGTTIAFAADWNSNFHDNLYTVPAAGGEPVRMTSNPLGDFGPTWSPDGTRIAFVSLVGLTESSICIIDAVPMASPLRLFSHQWAISGPVWSPDGTRIAFGADSASTSFAVYAIPAGGGPFDLLIDGEYRNSTPTWSPDGTRLAFSSNRSGNSEIWSWPLLGGDPTQLTDSQEFDTDPAWSPDGARIAFTSNRTGNREIWMMSADGRNLVQLTYGPGFSSGPSWSPDGSRIAFASRVGESSDIWILSLE